MNRLTYNKIVNSAIEIDLHNNYSAIAVILQKDNAKDKHIVSYYLKGHKTNVIIPIDELEEIAFNVEFNRLYPEILKYTATLLRDGIFDKYIEKYSQSVIEYFHEFHKTLDTKKE